MFIAGLSTRDIREIGYADALDTRPVVSKEGTREYREGSWGIVREWDIDDTANAGILVGGYWDVIPLRCGWF